MGAHSSKPPHGFPADLRDSITTYLNRGYRGVTMNVYINGRIDLEESFWTEVYQLDALVERCQGRKVRVENVKWHFIGNDTHFGFHDERERKE